MSEWEVVASIAIGLVLVGFLCYLAYMIGWYRGWDDGQESATEAIAEAWGIDLEEMPGAEE